MPSSSTIDDRITNLKRSYSSNIEDAYRKRKRIYVLWRDPPDLEKDLDRLKNKHFPGTVIRDNRFVYNEGGVEYIINSYHLQSPKHSNSKRR